MTALDLERLTPFAGTVPSRGSYGIKANVRIFKGALVGIDIAGRAMPADTIANGCLRIVGKASATYDNRTGSALGGAADAVQVDVEYGVFQFANSATVDAISAIHVGSVVFAIDDQTVALTPGAAARAVAGVVVEVRDSKPYVYIGPHAAPSGPRLQLVTGTLVAGLCTVTVGPGQLVNTNTRAFPVMQAVVTGSANVGTLTHMFASNVPGANGVGQVLFRMLGNDGATDVDAAGAFAALLIN